jgi:hypothetical protein
MTEALKTGQPTMEYDTMTGEQQGVISMTGTPSEQENNEVASKTQERSKFNLMLKYLLAQARDNAEQVARGVTRNPRGVIATGAGIASAATGLVQASAHEQIYGGADQVLTSSWKPAETMQGHEQETSVHQATEIYTVNLSGEKALDVVNQLAPYEVKTDKEQENKVTRVFSVPIDFDRSQMQTFADIGKKLPLIVDKNGQVLDVQVAYFLAGIPGDLTTGGKLHAVYSMMSDAGSVKFSVFLQTAEDNVFGMNKGSEMMVAAGTTVEDPAKPIDIINMNNNLEGLTLTQKVANQGLLDTARQMLNPLDYQEIFGGVRAGDQFMAYEDAQGNLKYVIIGTPKVGIQVFKFDNSITARVQEGMIKANDQIQYQVTAVPSSGELSGGVSLVSYIKPVEGNNGSSSENAVPVEMLKNSTAAYGGFMTPELRQKLQPEIDRIKQEGYNTLPGVPWNYRNTVESYLGQKFDVNFYAAYSLGVYEVKIPESGFKTKALVVLIPHESGVVNILALPIGNWGNDAANSEFRVFSNVDQVKNAPYAKINGKVSSQLKTPEVIDTLSGLKGPIILGLRTHENKSLVADSEEKYSLPYLEEVNAALQAGIQVKEASAHQGPSLWVSAEISIDRDIIVAPEAAWN